MPREDGQEAVCFLVLEIGSGKYRRVSNDMNRQCRPHIYVNAASLYHYQKTRMWRNWGTRRSRVPGVFVTHATKTSEVIWKVEVEVECPRGPQLTVPDSFYLPMPLCSDLFVVNLDSKSA